MTATETARDAADSGEFSRGWTVVMASAIGFGLGLSALPFYTNGVFVQPLSQEFGWSVSAIQGGILIMLMGSLFMSPVIGWIADKYGVRNLVLASILAFGLALASMSQINANIKSYYLGWALMAVGGSATLAITWGRAINTWFFKHRGLALGLALMGSGITGMIAPFATTALIEAYGWRTAYLVLAALPLFVALPLAYFFFFEATDAAKKRGVSVAEVAPGASGQMAAGLTPLQALGDWRFWLMGIAFFGISIGVGGIIPNTVKLLISQGYDGKAAALIAGLIGLFVIIGRVVSGFLIDRFWAPLVAFCFLSVPAVACLILAHGGMGLLATGLAVALIGLAAGAEFDLIAYMVSRYFGLKRFGAIYGMMFAFFALGSGAGPVIFGRVYDTAQSYAPILYIAAVLFALGAAMLLFLGKYPEFKDEEKAA